MALSVSGMQDPNTDPTLTGLANGTLYVQATGTGYVNWVKQPPGWILTTDVVPPPSTTPLATSLAVGPPVIQQPVGATVQLTAVVYDQRGLPMAGQAIGYASTVPGNASVTTGGLVTCLVAGGASIQVTSGDLEAIVPVTVTPTPPSQTVTTITVQPATATIQVVGTQAYSATAFDQNGLIMFGQTFTWTSLSTGVATMSGATATGVAAGTASIQAAIGSVTGTGTLTVITAPVVTTVTVAPLSATIKTGSPEGTVTLTATVLDQRGNVMTGQVIAWASTNTGYATVTTPGQTAVVTAVAVGNPTISASTGGQSGTCSVTVQSSAPPSPVVTTITVSPATSALTAPQTVQLTPTVYDQNGQVMAGQSVTWSTSSPAIATVSSTGLVTGTATGSTVQTATMTATSVSVPTVSGTASATVTPAQVVTTIVVSPGSTSIQVNSQQTLTATAYNQFGNTMTGVTFTWASSSPSVASVTSGGTVTGASQGNTNVSASASGVTSATPAAVTVIPIPPPTQTVYGVHTDLTFSTSGSNNANAFTQMGFLHVKIQRTSLLWDHIEGTQGTFVWTAHDDVLGRAQTAGIGTILVVVGSPNWANGSSGNKYVVPGTSVSDPVFTAWVANYVAWIKVAAARYASKVAVWELWNEWNQHYSWQPAPNQAMYNFWASQVYAAIKSVSATAVVCIGGVTGLTAGPAGDLTGQQAITGCYSAGFTADGICIHPYCENYAPNVTTPYNNSFTDIAVMRNIMVAYNQSNAKMYVTEWGWQGPPGGSLTAATVAGYVSTSLNMLATQYTYVTGATYFDLTDVGQSSYLGYGFYNASNAIQTSGTNFGIFATQQGQ